MARTPTSSTNSPAGFTLVELLVVLALLALAYGLAAPALTRSVAGGELAIAMRELSLALNQARSGAVVGGQPQRFVVDGLAGAYGIGPARKPLPGGMTLAAVVPDALRVSAHVAAIEFFPGGGSTGGRITLTTRGGGKSALSVDWLTGRVTAAE
ncbi:MAG: GspH/FimT family protein [Rhodospirillales bacterium]